MSRPIYELGQMVRWKIHEPDEEQGPIKFMVIAQVRRFGGISNVIRGPDGSEMEIAPEELDLISED